MIYGISLSKIRVIDVLKGSISIKNSAILGANITDKIRVAKIKYFIYTSLLFSVSDTLIFGKLRNLPKKCENSCNTPYGQSHPQKVPLPQITNETKTKNQIISEKGSYNKKVKLCEFTRAFKTPSTVTRLN